MTTPEPEKPTHDSAVAELCKNLINTFIKSSKDAIGETPMEKLKNAAKYDGNEPMWSGITALSSYLSVRAQERQAAALESLARTAASDARTTSATNDAQALVDDREPKRDYLASTYSLSTEQLSLLWAMRGIVMDAAVASLSRPQTFEPYERVSTEDMAWALRTTPVDLYLAMPKRNDAGDIDFRLLEEFGVFHYGGVDGQPDDWMYGG